MWGIIYFFCEFKLLIQFGASGSSGTWKKKKRMRIWKRPEFAVVKLEFAVINLEFAVVKFCFLIQNSICQWKEPNLCLKSLETKEKEQTEWIHTAKAWAALVCSNREPQCHQAVRRWTATFSFCLYSWFWSDFIIFVFFAWGTCVWTCLRILYPPQPLKPRPRAR